MKVLSRALLLMAILAFVLSGCSEKSAPIVGPADQVLGSPATSTGLSKCGSRVLYSLEGSANNYYDLWYGPDGSLWGTLPDPKGKFYTVETFHADAYSDGTSSGSFRYDFLGKLPPGVDAAGFFGKFEGKVIKLAVQGDKALAVVEIAKWNSSSLPAWFAQVFIDDGNGFRSRDKVSEWFTTQFRDIAHDSLGIGSRELWLTMGPNAFIQWTRTQLAAFPSVPILFPIDRGNIEVH